MARIYNFSAGPSVLPLPVLERAQAELVDYQGKGLSVMEMSHRSKEYDEIFQTSKRVFCEVFGLPQNYKLLYCTGGASLQFSMVPMNFLPDASVSADYIETGTWASKAIKEAKILGKTCRTAASTKAENFCRIPKQSELKLDANARYAHITTNNTVYGTQWASLPETGNVPLFCDMSSDIMSRRVDFSKIGLIYAGAQKNLAPAGLTIVIIRDDMLDKMASGLPTMLSYRTFVDDDSLYNTPPCYIIYMLKLVMEWIKDMGGLAVMEEIVNAKAKLLYDAIDAHGDFYKGTTEKESRSKMNVTFRLPTEALEEQFVKEAKKNSMDSLKGHRSVGGIRASLYNAMPMEGVKALVTFMEQFKAKNG